MSHSTPNRTVHRATFLSHKLPNLPSNATHRTQRSSASPGGRLFKSDPSWDRSPITSHRARPVPQSCGPIGTGIPACAAKAKVRQICLLGSWEGRRHRRGTLRSPSRLHLARSSVGGGPGLIAQLRHEILPASRECEGPGVRGFFRGIRVVLLC